MGEIFSFLSGQVPGGILVFLIILIIVNLIFIFLKSSKLISEKESKKKQITFSAVLIVFYIFLWFISQPPAPKMRIVVLPAYTENGKIQLKGSSFTFADLFQKTALNNLNSKYLLHRWQPLFETVGKDSAGNYQYWKTTAEKIKADIIVENIIYRDRTVCSAAVLGGKNEDVITYTLTGAVDYVQLLEKLNDDFYFFKQMPKTDVKPAPDYCLEAELQFLQHEFDAALDILKGRDDLQARMLKGKVYAGKGLLEKIDSERIQFNAPQIEEFDKARQIFAEIVRSKEDTPETAYWLGRMALHIQDYNRTELYLKNAHIGDRENSRIYYSLSFLLSRRLRELGFESRTAILEKAVYYDPGFRKAVYQLADEYFLSGSGIPSGAGAVKAKKVILDYLEIKNGEPNILSLLGSIYLKTSELDKAFEIFSRLINRFPDDSNSHYNMGIVFYLRDDYPGALKYFLKAIEMDDNLDSYLYAGLAYQKMGDKEAALKYYRQRVRKKTGDDDKYAREATKGIRHILADTTGGAVE